MNTNLKVLRIQILIACIAVAAAYAFI